MPFDVGFHVAHMIHSQPQSLQAAWTVPLRFKVVFPVKASFWALTLPNFNALQVLLRHHPHIDTHPWFVLVMRNPSVDTTTGLTSTKVLFLIVTLVRILRIDCMFNSHLLGVVVGPLYAILVAD